MVRAEHQPNREGQTAARGRIQSIAPVRASESAWLREGGHDAIHAAPAMTLDRSNGAWSACACREALEVPDITVGRIEQQEAGLRGHVAEVILVADPLRLLQNQRALVDAVRGCDTDDVWISEIRSLCFDCIAPSSTVVWMVAGSFDSATDFCSAARNAPLALFSRATLASPCSSGAGRSQWQSQTSRRPSRQRWKTAQCNRNRAI